jgi:hypothetical protein
MARISHHVKLRVTPEMERPNATLVACWCCCRVHKTMASYQGSKVESLLLAPRRRGARASIDASLMNVQLWPPGRHSPKAWMVSEMSPHAVASLDWGRYWQNRAVIEQSCTHVLSEHSEINGSLMHRSRQMIYGLGCSKSRRAAKTWRLFTAFRILRRLSPSCSLDRLSYT